MANSLFICSNKKDTEQFHGMKYEGDTQDLEKL